MRNESKGMMIVGEKGRKKKHAVGENGKKKGKENDVEKCKKKVMRVEKEEKEGKNERIGRK